MYNFNERMRDIENYLSMNFSEDQKWDVWLRTEKRRLGLGASLYKLVAKNVQGDKKKIKSEYLKKYSDFMVRVVGRSGVAAAVMGGALGSAAGVSIANPYLRMVRSKKDAKDALGMEKKRSMIGSIAGAGLGAAAGVGLNALRNRIKKGTGGSMPVRERFVTRTDIKVLPAGAPCPGKEVK